MIFVVLKIADRNLVEKCVSFLMYKDINRKLVCNFFFCKLETCRIILNNCGIVALVL